MEGPHDAASEFLLVASMTAGLVAAHGVLNNGVLALFLGPELMANILPEATDDASVSAKADGARSKLSAAQTADADNEDLQKFVKGAVPVGGVNVKLHTTIQDTTMTIVSIVLFGLYASVLLDPSMNATAETRMYGTCDASFWAFRLHCASALYECMLYVHIGKDKVMYLHHVAVLVNFSRALTFGFQHYYGAWLGTVEGTNPFLSAVFAMMRLGLQDSPWLARATAGLLVSFLFLRVVSLPLAYVSHAADRGAVRKGQPLAGGGVSLLESDDAFFRLGRGAIVFLWVLSTFWFIKMLQGVLKRARATAKHDTDAATTTATAKKTK